MKKTKLEERNLTSENGETGRIMGDAGLKVEGARIIEESNLFADLELVGEELG